MQRGARESFWLGEKASPGAEHRAGNCSPAWEHISSVGHLLILPQIPSLLWAFGWLGERRFFQGQG